MTIGSPARPMNSLFETRGSEVVLLASRDKKNQKLVFPRIPANSPSAFLYEDAELSGPAELYSYTIIHPNPKTGKQPFAIGLVDYASGGRVFARISAPLEDVRIGMALSAVTTEGTDGPLYGFAQAQE